MSGTKISLSGLLIALLGLGVARGQDNTTASVGIPNPLNVESPEEWPPPTQLGPPAGPSTWLTYCRPDGCCGPLGKCGPIGTELYVRSGIEQGFGSGYFARNLDLGWTIQGGGRVLFFDPAMQSAWTVDAGITTNHSNSNNKDEQATLFNVPVKFTTEALNTSTIPFTPTFNIATATATQIQAAVRALNRTAVGLGIGREWYLLGDAAAPINAMNWRAGTDLGGRWGEGSVDLVPQQAFNPNIPGILPPHVPFVLSTIPQQVTFPQVNHNHLTGRYGQFYVAAHSDLEIPSGTCIFTVGVRVEYGYMWSSFLQRQNDGDLSEISITATFGVRF